MTLCTVLEHLWNYIQPYNVTMEPLVQDIVAKEKIVETYAQMATMGRIKGMSSTILKFHIVIIKEQPLMEL